MTKLSKSISVLCLTSTLILTPGSVAHAAEPFTVYMSSTGSDAADGSTASTAVVTLDRVEEIIRNSAPSTDVEVRITQGTYVAGQTNWDTFLPGHSITFMPIDYNYGEGIADIAGRPVFRGNGTGSKDHEGHWLYVHGDGNTRLRFYYLTVESYINGIQINGGYATIDGYRIPTGNGAHHNRIFGMVFRYLGSKWVHDDGYGAVILANSAHNQVQNNIFRNLENATNGIIHALYIEHGAADNEVVGNKFTDISGAPVRIRNRVNGTDVHGNQFTRTGTTGAGAYSEWFCGNYCVTQNPASSRECSSINGTFWNNTVNDTYAGLELPHTTLSPSGATNTGGGLCPPLAGPRVTAWDNV
jgi:hypothetical protein